MDFLGKRPKADAKHQPRTRAAGRDAALAHLRTQGLKLVERNYRTPEGRGGGKSVILRDRDGSLVFVEVRSRNRALRRVPAAASAVSSSSASCWPPDTI